VTLVLPIAAAGALVLISAGASHVLSRSDFASAFSWRHARRFEKLLGIVEIGVGLVAIGSLLSPRFAFARTMAGSLYVLFAAFLMARYLRHPGSPCGCQNGMLPSWFAIARASVFGAALLIVTPLNGPEFDGPAILTLLLASVGLTVLAWHLPQVASPGRS
jgi:hypothetical protein